MNGQNLLRTIVNEDGTAILNTHAGTMTTLNATGAYIWQALERGETAEAIAADLARKTGEAVDLVERDIVAFLIDLREQHLLSY
jgi:coenzyme PQQ synthesis protein D (PqqD)